MNPLTYLGFTIFSIIMQFCVMEFIHERFQIDKDSSSLNGSINKDNDFIKDIKYKPHALFYRSETDKTFESNNDVESAKYTNATLDLTILTSTDISTTFEVYYENTSIIDDFFTTETYSTSSDFDNVTEITFLDKNDTTMAKPSVKKVSSKDCFCDLLYQTCDVQCCCDTDCTDEERSMFLNCTGGGSNVRNQMYFCNSHPTCLSSFSTDVFNDLFCVVKVNLPDKRTKTNYQLNIAALNATFKWNSITKSENPIQYQKNKYKYGDPIWLLKNGAISTWSLPTTMTNYYCNSNKQISFLANENIKCYVKLKDLYMFSALKALEGTKLISATELSINATVLNCSTLHCTNWTVLACNENKCSDYNKSIHAPVCTDKYCNNLAQTMEYIFYNHEAKITNASLKMYLTKIPVSTQLLVQKIAVKWYLSNESIDNIIQLSGNPGYIPGLPLIVLPVTKNLTQNFYNRTLVNGVLVFPHNVNGQCNWLNIKNKTLLFGLNTRLKCRLTIEQEISLKNATSACQTIQINIKERLRLNETLFISPYGNPRDCSDDKWIPLEVYDRTFVYGEYRSKTKLVCYNLATRYAFVIAYADTSGITEREKNRVVKATVNVSQLNITFDLVDLSIVLTIDVRFVDMSKPVTEYARAPNLNLHWPADFFFDYPSNYLNRHSGDIVLLLNCCILLVMIK